MSVLFQGMPIPKTCTDCPCSRIVDDEDCYRLSCPFLGEVCKAGSVLNGCPAFYVPPHGKLIDADKLIARLEEQRTVILHELPAAHAREEGYTKEDYIFERNGDLISMLRNQAAVIPATETGERSE